MPSTTPDFSTVIAGAGSAVAGGGTAALAVDSAGACRFVRRCGGTSADRARSGFGQASSKLAGGTSPGSDGAGLYASASGAYNSNRAKSIANHVAMTGEDATRPAVPQWRPRADLGAANLPTPMTIAANAMAPGERR